MQGIDAFLDTSVRIDEGTRVLLCAHRSCARTAAWLYAAIFLRGTEPMTFLFDDEGVDMEMAIDSALDDMRACPGVRRVAIVVCEPAGPSFVRLFEQHSPSKSDKMPIFRISGSTSTNSESVGRAVGSDTRYRRTTESPFFSEHIIDETNEEHGLSESEIDELLTQCEFEMAGLDDCDIEEVAAMSAEEIGSLTDEELAALAELEDSELMELAGWGEEDFRVLA
jgi:hypothetical protein